MRLKYNSVFNLKKVLTLIISILWVCGQYSCEDPSLDNPFGGDITPDVTIDNESLNGSIIYTPEITIKWTPNIYAFEFSYLLDPIHTIWSEWSGDTTAYYNHLDEGEYKFFIKSRYDEEVEMVNPDSLLFTVDAVIDSSLRIYPLYSEVNSSDLFSIDIASLFRMHIK